MFRHVQAVLWLASRTFAYMRKLFLLLMLAIGNIGVYAQDAVALQDDTVTAPYLKYRDLPAFDAEYLNGKDTFSTFNIPKGTPSMIVYFSPDCDHCQELIDAMLPRMKEFGNTHIYYMTFMPLASIQIFNTTRHLENYSNTRFIGRDFKFFFPTFYGVSSVPNVVLYDKDKKFVKLWPNPHATDVTELVNEIKKLK